MRIAYASDLHLEFDDSLTLTGLSTADVLVLAGDVDTMPEYYTEILRKLRLVYAGPVIFVLGNHEYYHGIFPDDRQKYWRPSPTTIRLICWKTSPSSWMASVSWVLPSGRTLPAGNRCATAST